jgi:ATP-dependent RNA helicase DHX8/PRP22
MDSMVVTPITQASARQRAGRAGRTRAGVCFRLYTEHAHNHEMLPQPVPEIQRSNLAAVVLQMKAMGVNDLMHFDFMDKPTPAALVGAQHELFTLGALDEEGTLTPMGRKMAEFPVLPNQAKVLLSSVDLRCSAEALTVVAMLNAEGVFYRPRDKLAQADQRIARFTQPEGDPLTLLAVYNGWAGAQYSKAWCHENFLQSRSLQAAFDIRKQLLATFDRYALDVVSCERNTKRVCQAIASGFFMNVAKKDPQEGYKTLVDAQTVYIHPGSVLFQKNPDWVLYFDLIVTSKEYMSKCMVIDLKWLPQVAPRFYRQADSCKLSKA